MTQGDRMMETPRERLERELEEARRHLRLSEYQVKRKQINADHAEAANRALRTSLEEARQELDRRDDEALGWRDENDKLRADLEEARQERDQWRKAVLTRLSGSDRECVIVHAAYCVVLGGDTPCSAQSDGGGTQA